MHWQRPWLQGGSLTHHPSLEAVALKVDSPSWWQGGGHGASDESDLSRNTGVAHFGCNVADWAILLLEADFSRHQIDSIG